MQRYGLVLVASLALGAWQGEDPKSLKPEAAQTSNAAVQSTAKKAKIMVAPTNFSQMTPLEWSELPPQRGAFRTPQAGLCIAARLFSIIKYQFDQCLVQFPLTAIPVPKVTEAQQDGITATRVSLIETNSEKYENPYFDSRWCGKASDKWGMIARGKPVGFPNLREGEFVTVLGSANSYGATVDQGKAWTELLGEETQTQFINIATGGAGPGYYLAGWPQFEPYLTKAKAVVVQMMSGRSVAIPRFLGGGKEMLRMATLGCDLRWQINGHGVDVLPFLQTLWGTNITTARTLINEMREEQEKEYLDLYAKIKAVNPDTKVILMWMSKRDLDNTFRPEDTEQWGKIMDFPHFTDKTMFERIGSQMDAMVNVKRPTDVPDVDWKSEVVPNKYCGCQEFAKEQCSLSEYRNNFEKGNLCECKAVMQDYYSTSVVHKETARLIGELLKTF